MTQSRPPAWAAFTDGSCWHKDRVGGWAWVAFNSRDDDVIKWSGNETDTTISRMELMGPIRFLEWLYWPTQGPKFDEIDGPKNVLIFSDSEHVIKGITDRSRARNVNIDLWTRLDKIVDSHLDVTFEHIKGHDTSYYNHEADRLAGEARKRLQSELLPTSRT